MVAIAKPNRDSGNKTGFSRTETRSRRIVKATNLAMIGLFLTCFDWRLLHLATGVNAKLEYVEDVLFRAQDLYCPIETFTVKKNRNFVVSSKLVHLSRLKSVEFKKNRYSPLFKELK